MSKIDGVSDLHLVPIIVISLSLLSLSFDQSKLVGLWATFLFRSHRGLITLFYLSLWRFLSAAAVLIRPATAGSMYSACAVRIV